MFAVALTTQAQSQKDHHFEVAKNLDIFNNIYKNLELLYVDTLDPKETIGTGINAMLRSLDPYTEYYASDETKDLKMMLTGKYAVSAPSSVSTRNWIVSVSTSPTPTCPLRRPD